MRTLLGKGVKNPDRIPPFVIGRLFPKSRWGPNWQETDDGITFTTGGFVSSPRNRPEFASKLYCEAKVITRILDDALDKPVGNALEIGCGYGRLTPWLSPFAETVHGVDINETAIAKAREQHPAIEFEVASATDLPVPSSSQEVVMTWTVLQHVPDKEIKDAAAEIDRVLSDDGLVLVCERTKGSGSHTWSRSPQRYRDLLNRSEILVQERKPVEPTWSGDGSGIPPEHILLLR